MPSPSLHASRKTKMTSLGKIPVDWGIVRLAQVATFQTGIAKGKKGIKDPVELPYLRVANVQDGYLDLREVKTITVARAEVERYRLRKNDVLLTEGGDFDKLGRGHLWDGQIDPCLHQNHVFVVRPNPEVLLPSFFALQSASPHGRRYFQNCSKQTTNLASINSTQLKQFPALLPPIAEQRCIASLLAVWDRAIEQSERLVEAKRKRTSVLLRRLLTGQERTAGFRAGAWKRVRLSEVVAQVNRRNTVGCATVLTGSANHGLIDQRDFYARRVASADTSSYYLIRRGEFAYNRSSANGYPYGATKRLDAHEMGTLSTLYLVFRISDEQHFNSDFAAHLFDSNYFNGQLARLCREGARSHGLLNISAREFFGMHAVLPSLPEQKRIATVLNDCDRELDLLDRQTDALRTQKRGLMQKLLTGEVRVRTRRNEA